ncbi:MAG: dihydrofolate reductase [Chitinophagaceae bacterium]
MGVSITLVVAASNNNAIGKDNKLLWHLPNDMKYFKNVTWGMPVVMGRKSFESLGKALPGRKNIVLTKQSGWKAVGVVTVKNFDDALFVVKEMEVKEMMVIGGGEIYRSVFDKAKRIHITRVDAEFEEADTFFPVIDPKVWQLISQKNHEADAKHKYGYSFQVWERS